MESQPHLHPHLDGRPPHMTSNDRLTGRGPENGVEIEVPRDNSPQQRNEQGPEVQVVEETR